MASNIDKINVVLLLVPIEFAGIKFNRAHRLTAHPTRKGWARTPYLTGDLRGYLCLDPAQLRKFAARAAARMNLCQVRVVDAATSCASDVLYMGGMSSRTRDDN